VRLLPAFALALCGCDAVLRLEHVTKTPDASIPIDGLVAHYELETLDLSGTGPCVTDSAGFHHDGTCSGIPVVVPGHIGYALAFDGTSYITIKAAADLDSTNGLTVAMWINIPTLPSVYMCPVNRLYGDPTLGANSWQLCIAPNPVYFFDVGPNAIYTSTPDVDRWHHLVLLWHPDVMTAWLDGLNLQMPTPTTLAYDASAMTLGADMLMGMTDAPFVGTLDDVRIYNRELSADEIIALATM
jgi:hypothetical protein